MNALEIFARGVCETGAVSADEIEAMRKHLAEFEDDHVAWVKEAIHTDMPDGEWLFLMADELEGDCRYRIILMSEY